MELSLLLAEQIVSLFLYVVAGYVCVKAGILKYEDSKVISNFVVYVSTPCMTICAFQIDLTDDKLEGLLLAVGAAIFVHAAMIAVTRLIGDLAKFNAIERASLVYSNAGNLIIPLVAAVLGPESVFYTSAYNFVQTVLFWTHCSTLIGEEKKADVKKILLNPNMIAIFIGFALFVTGLRAPAILDTCLQGFGSTIGPVGMFVLGMIIANADLKRAFAHRKSYLICLMRLIVYPAVVAVIFAAVVHMGIHRDAERILLIVLLATCAPVAVMVTQISQIMNRDSQYASVINVMSIVFCILTMPLIVMFYQTLV